MSTVVRKSGDQTASESSVRFWSLGYFLLTVALGGMFVSALFPRVEIRISLVLIFLALLVLTLKRWTGAFLLLIVQLHLYYFDPRNLPALTGTAGIFWVFFSVLLVAVISRYRTLQEQDRQAVATSLGNVWKQIAHPDPVASRRLFDNLGQVLVQVAKLAIVIGMSAYVASQLLASVPLNPEARGFTIREYRLIPTGYRVIMLGLKLFCIALVSWIAINELVWRSLSKRQAAIYLRSTFLGWIHRDFRMIAKRRIKHRKANTRGMEPTVSESTLADSDLDTAVDLPAFSNEKG